MNQAWTISTKQTAKTLLTADANFQVDDSYLTPCFDPQFRGKQPFTRLRKF